MTKASVHWQGKCRVLSFLLPCYRTLWNTVTVKATVPGTSMWLVAESPLASPDDDNGWTSEMANSRTTTSQKRYTIWLSNQSMQTAFTHMMYFFMG